MEKSITSAGRLTTRQIAVVGMLSSVSIVLGASGYGFIPLPIAKVTIMHIPVIIGAILEGPVVGALIGLIFGIFSIIQNIVAPTSALSFAFLNPLVSVLPRVLIGITSYYCYKLAFGKNDPLKVGIGAAVGSLTNTVGVLGMIYVFYAARFAEISNIDPSSVAKVLFGVASFNGSLEAAAAVLITVPVVYAIRRIKK